MQKLFAETKNRGLLRGGLGMVASNKRYIFWFWLLNLTLAAFGTSAFLRSAHAALDHSLFGDRLVHGFDLPAMSELFFRPEFGRFASMSTPALCFAFLFFVATAMFLPGIFAGYGSSYRLPREDFFRACGQNLWRFIRLMIIAGIVMSIAAGLLFSLHGAIEKKAGESTNELLLPYVQGIGLLVIFLVMTGFRIWFDLAEADVVLSDQRAVRKSIWAGLRHTLRSLIRLLASYAFVSIIAAIILVAGLWAWIKFVAPEGVLRAFLVGQLTLLLLLIPRFWQRGVAVSYWQQRMWMPVVAAPPEPIAPQPAAVASGPESTPLAPSAAPESGGTPV